MARRLPETTDGPDSFKGGLQCLEHHGGTRTGIHDSCCCCSPCLYERPITQENPCRCIPKLVCFIFTGDAGQEECCTQVTAFSFATQGDGQGARAGVFTTYAASIGGVDLALTIESTLDTPSILNRFADYPYGIAAFWGFRSTALGIDQIYEIDHVNTVCLTPPSIAISGVTISTPGGSCVGTITFGTYQSAKVPFSRTLFPPPDSLANISEDIAIPYSPCNCGFAVNTLCVYGRRHGGDDDRGHEKGIERVVFRWNEALGDRWSYTPPCGNVLSDQEHIYLRGDGCGNCYLELDFNHDGIWTNDWADPPNTDGETVHAELIFANGTTNWVPSANCIPNGTEVTFECIGAGQAGVGGSVSSGGAGGTGGGYAKAIVTITDASLIYPVVVEAGNSALSTKVSDPTSTVICSAASGASGGAGLVGSVLRSGGAGGAASSTCGGGGGSAAGEVAGNVGAAGSFVGGVGGAGVTQFEISPRGAGGSGGNNSDDSAYGLAGSDFGGGGGGGGYGGYGFAGNGASGSVRASWQTPIRSGMLPIDSCVCGLVARSETTRGRFVVITAGWCEKYTYSKCYKCRCVPEKICVIGSIDGQIVTEEMPWDGDKWTSAGDVYLSPFSLSLARGKCDEPAPARDDPDACAIKAEGTFLVPIPNGLINEPCSPFMSFSLTSPFDPAYPDIFNWLIGSAKLCESCKLTNCGPCHVERCGGSPETLYVDLEAVITRVDFYNNNPSMPITTIDYCNLSVTIRYYQYWAGRVLFCGYIGTAPLPSGGTFILNWTNSTVETFRMTRIEASGVTTDDVTFAMTKVCEPFLWTSNWTDQALIWVHCPWGEYDPHAVGHIEYRIILSE